MPHCFCGLRFSEWVTRVGTDNSKAPDDYLTRPANLTPSVYNEADRVFNGWEAEAPGQTLEWFHQQLQEQGCASQPRPDYMPPAQPKLEPAEPAPELEAETELGTASQQEPAK